MTSVEKVDELLLVITHFWSIYFFKYFLLKYFRKTTVNLYTLHQTKYDYDVTTATAGDARCSTGVITAKYAMITKMYNTVIRGITIVITNGKFLKSIVST